MKPTKPQRSPLDEEILKFIRAYKEANSQANRDEGGRSPSGKMNPTARRASSS